MRKQPINKLYVKKSKCYRVKDFFQHNLDELKLVLKTAESSLCTELIEVDLHRPGLALAGFTEVFSFQRLQLIGTSEWTYLESAGPAERRQIFKRLEEFRSPVWVLTHNFPPHKELKEMCRSQKVPILCSGLATMDFYTSAQRILEDWFSPYATIHGTLVDIYGVGMLYIGKSGVGKSECALDLVERGHRLVTDDSVILVRKANTIIGKANPSLGHHMEIRGVGIVEVGRLFGIRAIRDRKKVEIIVELQSWQKGVSYDRTGLDEHFLDIMGVKIPKKIVPITLGKNITVISEVIAMNMLLKMNGIDVARMFNDKLLKIMSRDKDPDISKIISSDFYE